LEKESTRLKEVARIHAKIEIWKPIYPEEQVFS
jgi:hypothetical protein